jgi:peptide/nickel transport system substrate-binding protein
MKKKHVSRRNFLKVVGAGSAGLALGGLKAHPVLAKKGERFIFTSYVEINSADPAAHMDVGRTPLRLNFYDGLVRFRDNLPKLTPNLALSYDATPDAKKWTFHLRKGAKFHDGSEVTSEEVVYSIERLLALGTGSASVFAPLVEKGSTRAVDRYTVEFNLNKPNGAFAGFTHFLHVLNKKVLQKHDKGGDLGSEWLSRTGSRLGSDGVGTGSYTVERFNPAEGFEGKSFKDHFLGWSRPHMERIGYKLVHEQAARILGLMKGDFHGDLGYMPYEQLVKLRKNPTTKVITERSMRLFTAFMHCQKPPTNDVHFRRAVCYAFDYESWIRDMQHNMVERNIGPVPNTMWGSLDPKKEFGYTYDLDKARAELKKCKVDWKKYLPITQVIQTGMHMHVEVSQLLQAGLNRIGIRNNIVPKTWPTCTEITRRQETTPSIWWSHRSTYYPDPHNWIGEMHDSDKWGSWGSSSWYKNPKVDDLLHKGISIVDQEERKKLYEEAGRIVVSEAPGIFIHNEMWNGPFNVGVKGHRFCPVGDSNEYRWLYWG